MAAPRMGQAARGEGGGEKLDISRDFCCFLCNGFIVVQGSITLQPSFVRLSVATGRVLEEFEYSSVYSVNDEEPPTTHSLIFNLTTHSVYVCHLLRKERLLKVFQSLGLYKPDVRLPAESMGFPTGGKIIGQSCGPHTPHLMQPHNIQVSRPRPHTHDAVDGQHWQNKPKSKNNSEPLHAEGLFPPESESGGQKLPSSLSRGGSEEMNNLQTSASGAMTSDPTHFNDLLPSQDIHSPPVPKPKTTPPNQPKGPTQQLRYLRTLFPHLSEECLQGVLEQTGHNSEEAIEAVMASDALANAPQPASLSAAHTA